MYNMNKFFEFISAFQKSIRWCEVNDSRYFAQRLMGMGYPGAVFNRLILISENTLQMLTLASGHSYQ